MSGAGESAGTQYLDFVSSAAEIAREAGARLREFFAQGVETEYKGDVDLVTVADRTVEKLIKTSPDAAEILVAECREASSQALADLRDLVRG